MTAMAASGCSVRQVRSQRAQAVSSACSSGAEARVRLDAGAACCELRRSASRWSGRPRGGLLRGCFGVEADEEIAVREGEVSGGDCGAEGFGELGFGEVLRAGAAAFELGGPAGEGAGVGVAGEGREALAAAVVVKQLPGVGGGFGERVDGAQACGRVSVAMIARQRVRSCAELRSRSVAWPSSRRRFQRLVVQVSQARMAGGCQLVRPRARWRRSKAWRRVRAARWLAVRTTQSRASACSISGGSAADRGPYAFYTPWVSGKTAGQRVSELAAISLWAGAWCDAIRVVGDEGYWC